MQTSLSRPSRTTDRRVAVLLLRPLKKKGRIPDKVPIHFAEGKHDGADTYWHLHRLVELDPVNPEDMASTPLFRIGSKPLPPETLRKHVKKIARSLGFPKREFGLHSLRIGGATDLADKGASPLLLQAKGRWSSDIGKIYARMTRRSQIAVSLLMQEGKGGRDLEELFPSFAQPA